VDRQGLPEREPEAYGLQKLGLGPNFFVREEANKARSARVGPNIRSEGRLKHRRACKNLLAVYHPFLDGFTPMPRSHDREVAIHQIEREVKLPTLNRVFSYHQV
jgi:hypothetical protein